MDSSPLGRVRAGKGESKSKNARKRARSSLDLQRRAGHGRNARRAAICLLYKIDFALAVRSLLFRVKLNLFVARSHSPRDFHSTQQPAAAPRPF